MRRALRRARTASGLFNSFLHLSTTIKRSSSFKTTPISVQLPPVKEMICHSPLSLDLFLLVYLSIHQQESYLELLYLPFLSQTSPFKHPIKSDQLNSQSAFKSLFLYPIFIILISHSLLSKYNHSQSLQSFQETILYSQSLQELFLLVYLSINQLESFLVFLHLHSHLHSSSFRLPINLDSFKLNYPLLSMLYPLSLSFSSLLLFLSFSFSLFLLSFERSLIYICIGTIGLGSFQSHIKPTQIILLKPTNHLFQLIILLTCYQISQFMIIQLLLIHRNRPQICISNHLFSCICL